MFSKAATAAGTSRRLRATCLGGSRSRTRARTGYGRPQATRNLDQIDALRMGSFCPSRWPHLLIRKVSPQVRIKRDFRR